MVELSRGIKAGVVAGLIYGVVYTFFFMLLLPWRNTNPWLALITGPIFGAILGIIFAFTSDRLPGKKLGEWTVSTTRGAWSVSMVKSAILSFAVWVLLFLLTIPTGFPTGLYISESGQYRTYQIFVTAFALFLFVSFLGVQLGYFWDKFEPK